MKPKNYKIVMMTINDSYHIFACFSSIQSRIKSMITNTRLWLQHKNHRGFQSYMTLFIPYLQYDVSSQIKIQLLETYLCLSIEYAHQRIRDKWMKKINQFEPLPNESDEEPEEETVHIYSMNEFEKHKTNPKLVIEFI